MYRIYTPRVRLYWFGLVYVARQIIINKMNSPPPISSSTFNHHRK